ncbi:ABC transporter substrate-binding protein [Aureibacillus halotolerans]|uniref:Carbohydrate ABC transporter substrate-binding protein (CUT1 family) n=1 Tax=Aureibacillus halotolerans TaxID=1508390 RepID=A0A4R6UDR6_9BACI|nr:extracellular solute-binding protein [Aureibacillus halotolerans]TDQ42945.1 carbohydrate ABC transporter substrate-binding protein (CUT1 family) [Aureibacillus halotolerans]
MKKWSVLASLVGLFLLTACGTQSSSNENEGKIELTFWNNWAESSAQNDASLTRVEAFMEENPDIVINQQNIPHDQYKVKLKTQAAGNELPDLMQVWPGSEITPLVQAGLLAPIDDILDQWEGKVTDAQLAGYRVDDKQYALPLSQAITAVVFYDKAMLAEAGYESFPETYKDFKSLIQTLRDNDIIPITFGNKAQWPMQSVYMSTIGDRLTGSDFLEKVIAGEAKFTDPKFIEAVGVIKELADMEAFNEDFNAIDSIQHRALFTNGEAAMMVDGLWSVGPIAEQAPEDKEIGIARFPAIEGGEGNPETVPSTVNRGIAINSSLEGEELEAAKQFLKFFYSDEFYQELMKAEIVPAANVPVPEEVNPMLKTFIEYANGDVSPVYDAVLPVEVINKLNSGLQSVTLGQMTPEELAQELQETLDR